MPLTSPSVYNDKGDVFLCRSNDASKPNEQCRYLNTEEDGNAVICDGCEKWIHHKCTTLGKRIIESLAHFNISYVCNFCRTSKKVLKVRDYHDEFTKWTGQIMQEIKDTKLELKETLNETKQKVDDMATQAELSTTTVDGMKQKIDNMATSAELSANTVTTAQNELNAVVNTVKEQNVKIEEQNKEIVNKIEAVADGAQPPDDGGGVWHEQMNRNKRKSLAKAARLAKQESNTLIIKPNDGQTTEDMCKVVKSTLKNIKIDKMKITHQKSVILNLPDTESINKAKSALQHSNDVTETRKIQPKIKIPYVPVMELGNPRSEADKTDFVENIRCKNDCLKDISAEELTVINAKKAKRGEYYHVILKCSPRVRKAICLNDDWIYTTYGHHQIYDHYYVKICNFCQEFNHIEEDCKKKIDRAQPICGKCAENHESNQCPNEGHRQKLKCHNCVKRKLYNDFNHVVYDRKCPAYAEQVRRLMENTEHGF